MILTMKGEETMKKLVCLLSVLLCLAMISPALALMPDSYRQHMPNEATFETIEEAHVNALSFMQETYPAKNFAPDSALDGYPEGTTYVYRSAGMFDVDTAADRMNTNILVYVDEKFETKEDALKYIKDLGLTDLVDEATGSVVLVTPITPETMGSSGLTGGFGEADQKAFYQLQAVMCNINAMAFGPAGIMSYADPGYFGGITFRYLIGINGGATFINNYVSTQFDFISRIAGLLLINGEMEPIRRVAALVPATLLNADNDTIAKYCAANETNAVEETKAAVSYFNQERPLQKVTVLKNAETSPADAVRYAYYNMFIHAQRVPVVKSGLYASVGQYSDHGFNQAPYSLCRRNPILNGKTPDGIAVIEHQEERFNAIQASNGEFLKTWYEFLPEEVLDGTAAEHSVPLVLACHGGGDDPVQAVDNLGLTVLAGDKRLAIVAPRHASDIPGSGVTSPSPYDIQGKAFAELVRYMLDTYPALDPSRVYVTGYSMGGSSTVEVVAGSPELFAAAVPMAAATPSTTDSYIPTEEEAANFANWDIPILFTTSSFDLSAGVNQADGTLGRSYLEHINRFLGFNEMQQVEYDFEKYPFVGFEADEKVTKTLNNEYRNTTWYLSREDGAPMVGVSFTEFLPHGLYPEYANLFWDYVKHFSRNQETGAIEYNPYVK